MSGACGPAQGPRRRQAGSPSAPPRRARRPPRLPAATYAECDGATWTRRRSRAAIGRLPAPDRLHDPCGRFRRCRRRVMRLDDFGDEAVATAWQRLDEPGRGGRVAECLAETPDRGVQTEFEVNEGVVGPQLPPQVIAADDLPALPNEQAEQAKRLLGQSTKRRPLASSSPERRSSRNSPNRTTDEP